VKEDYNEFIVCTFVHLTNLFGETRDNKKKSTNSYKRNEILYLLIKYILFNFFINWLLFCPLILLILLTCFRMLKNIIFLWLI